MGLMEKAYETYVNHKHLAGKVEDGKSPLVPVAHMMQNVQLEITIDIDGNYVSINQVSKEDTATLIPITVKSGSRSGKYPVAHPLCDKLPYLLKDDSWQYKAYIEQLENWSNSKYSNKRLKAIWKYVTNGTLLDDLNNCGINFKENDMVRWRVIGDDSADNGACCQSLEMFKSWQEYYFSTMDGKKGLCMLSGEETILTDSHAKGIVAMYNNSKLISANDSSNFTYRGRFLSSEEALTMGYIASQYAHSALTWLTRNQGVRFIAGGRTFICWNPKGYKVPSIWGSLFGEDDKNDTSVTPSDYKDKVRDALAGFRNDLPNNEDVVIASFDAATTGRLSLTYYCELKGSDFLKRVENWYSTCSWYHGKFGVQSPNVNDIVKYAYGIPKSDGSFPEVNEKVYREQFQRVLKCVSEQAVIPYDMMMNLVNHASRPQSYKNNRSNAYRKLLFITCALVRKYHNDKLKGEEWTLKLDPNKKDRSYQFGRLLAVMEKVETDTYNVEEQRESNAIRLQSAYCDRPWHYTEVIHQKLAPYFSKQKPKARHFFRRLIGEIMEELSTYPEKELDKKLSETYLLGYYLQRNELYKKNDKKVEENESEE